MTSQNDVEHKRLRVLASVEGVQGFVNNWLIFPPIVFDESLFDVDRSTSNYPIIPWEEELEELQDMEIAKKEEKRLFRESLKLEIVPIESSHSLYSLKCPISRDIMLRPVKMIGCSHIFEEDHIVTWCNKVGNCPLCRAEYEGCKKCLETQKKLEQLCFKFDRNDRNDHQDGQDVSFDHNIYIISRKNLGSNWFRIIVHADSDVFTPIKYLEVGDVFKVIAQSGEKMKIQSYDALGWITPIISKIQDSEGNIVVFEKPIIVVEKIMDVVLSFEDYKNL